MTFLPLTVSLLSLSDMKRRTRHQLLRSAAPAAAALALTCTLPGCATAPDSFVVADTDGDGRVSPAEFKRFMLEAVFGQADVTRDKVVTFDEWLRANPDADRRKFDVPDTNSDGVVTPHEMKAHFDREGTMEDLFAKMDTDKDGYLSRDEVAAFKANLESQSGTTSLQKLSRAAQN